MLPTTKIKVKGTEVTALVDTGGSASFLQTEWSKQNAVETYTSKDAYQVRMAIFQEETVNQEAQKKLKKACFNIPHTFLMDEIAPNCILGSDFLAKMAAEVDFQAKELCLH